MSVDPAARVQEFKSTLEADLASVEADFGALKSNLDRLGRERDNLRRLLEEADRMLSSIKGGNELPHALAVAPSKAEHKPETAPLQNSTATMNGSSQGLSRRQMILQMLPDFHGETFTSGDIRERLLREYLEVEPPHFPQAINNLLKQMAKRGEITRLGRQGDKPGDPAIYQANEDQGEMSLES